MSPRGKLFGVSRLAKKNIGHLWGFDPDLLMAYALQVCFAMAQKPWQR